jgi:hypothetical protein
MSAAWKDPAKHKLNLFRYDSYRVLPYGVAEVRLDVKLKNASNKYAAGRYIVYGIGPSGESKDIICSKIMAKLKPITDGTHALSFKEVMGKDGRRIVSPDPNMTTVIGYEAEGTGLKNGFEVFGAMSGQIGRAIQKSADRMRQIADLVDQTRREKAIFAAISIVAHSHTLPDGTWLGAPLPYLAKQNRADLVSRLQREISIAAPSDHKLKSRLEMLANEILAYHTASAYDQMGAKDPNRLENFKNLLDKVSVTLPKGTVGDHGQLTSINVAIGAYATMKGSLPKYMPKQMVTGFVACPDGKSRAVGHTTAGNINFNLDNAQNIAIFICASYPNIPPQAANDFVDEIVGKRRNSDMGFTNVEVGDFKRRLAQLEQSAIAKAFV